MELFRSSDVCAWKQCLSSHQSVIESLSKPNLVSLDAFYRTHLPRTLHERDPEPFITRSELTQLMQWKLTRGKWRPRLLGFVSALDETHVESATKKAFASLPDLAKAVTELTALKGVGPATASAVLAAYAPEVAPFMSDEAMMAALGNTKDYTLKNYLAFAENLQSKAKELSIEDESFTPSDIEMALWSSVVGATSLASASPDTSKASQSRSTKRKRKL